MGFNFKSENSSKEQEIIDAAWDKFSDYIGEHNLRTPLSLEQFEEIFAILNQSGQFTQLKNKILYSFRHDSYSWPLVQREENTL